MNDSSPSTRHLLRSIAGKIALRAVVCGSVVLAEMAAGAIAPAVFADPTRAANNDGGALSSTAGDFNNDGRAEFVSIASKHSNQPHFRIYTYDPGTQGFITYNVMSQTAVGNRKDRFGGDLAVGDMNNDGFKDIIVPESNNDGGAGQMSWFQNPGGNLGGVWTEQVITTWNGGTGENVEHLAELAVADIDGNGWLDLVTRDVSHGSWLMLRSSNGTGWQPRRFIAMNPREGLELWDMDQDGDLDLLLNGRWLETPADPLAGTFLPHTIAAAWYPSAITGPTILDFASKVDCGDFNGDGRKDVVITNGEELQNDPSTESKPKGVRLYLSPADPANGAWTEVILNPSNFSWQSLQIGDLDRDGDLDIVTGISQVGLDNAAPFIVAFLNDGTGMNFEAQTIDIGQDNFNQVVFIYNSTLADADGDGDLDLFGPHDWNNGPIRYYQNISSPATTQPPAAPANLTATLTSASRIDLEWNDQSNNESGFKIERSVNSSAFVQIAQTGANATSISDPGLSAGTEYAYRVRAFNVIGNSAYTLVVSAATPGDTTAPTLVSASSVPGGTVTAVFSEPVERASAENLSNYSLAGGAVVTAVTLAADGRTVTLTTSGLSDGGTYNLTATGIKDLSVARNPSNTVATFVYKAWLSQDVGAVAATGNTVSADPTVTVTGSGADIYGAADEFRFAYRTVAGDVTVIARVASQTRASGYSKAGVMIRETLDSGSKHALMALTPDYGGELDFRAATGGSTGYASYNPAISPGVDAPYWVKIVRQGNVLTGSVSADGVQWEQAGSATVSMGSVIMVGLAVTSQSDGAFSTARFENVSVTAALDWTSWRNQNFTGAEQTAGLAAANADPDSDNFSNLAEYALGSNPRQFTAPLATVLDQNSLSLTFTRPASLPGVSYGAEASGDLITWTPVALELLVPGATETVRASVSRATGNPFRRFLRLRFDKP